MNIQSKNTASIRINFAMQLFDKLNLKRASCIQFDVFNLFNFKNIKNTKEQVTFKIISQECITK